MAFKRSMPSRREARFEWSLADLISNDRFWATRDGPSAEAERPLFLGKGDLRRQSSRDGLAPKAVTRPCQRERLNSTPDRDRGTPRGATPPTPPGIRVRTTAVRSS